MKKLLYTVFVSIALMFTLSGNVSADNFDRRVVIMNATPLAILQVFGSNIGASTWENDILGNNIIPAYSTATINFNDQTGYCHFDLKAVMFNGQRVIKTNVNVCAATTWTIIINR